MTDDNLRDALQGMRQPEPGAVWIKDVLAYVEPELNRLNIYIENQREPWQAKVAELEQENARLRAGQAELPPDPGNLPARMAEVIGSHEWDGFPRSAHNQHNYYGACAVCQRDILRMAEVATAALVKDPGNLPKRMAEAIAEKFTSPKLGKATKETNWKSPVLDTLADRVDKGMAVIFTAGDGGLSGRSPTPREVAEVALGVRDELVASLSARVAAAEARVGHAEAGAELSSERLAEVRQEHQAKIASLQAFGDRCRERDWAHSAEQAKRREAAERKLYEIAMVKVWTNEDGRRFVFADDLAGILLTAPAEGTTTPARETA